MSKGSLRGSTQYCGLSDTRLELASSGCKIELALFRGLAGQDLQQFGVADEFGERAHAHARP